jgi:CHAD domain-containing protein
MTAIADQLLSQVVRLQVRLLACRERLAAQTDPEALHDLRIALRQLRSLLRPLADLPCCAALQQRAAALGRLSGPLRDLEVLACELHRQGLPAAAAARAAQLAPGYAQLLASPALAELLQALDSWPAHWHQAAAAGQLRGLPRLIRRRLHKDRQRLLQALRDPAHDRHRLRLLIKRLRYGAEQYPQQAANGAALSARLKQAQGALGDGHDHWQWLLRSEGEADLLPCRPVWQQAMELEAQRADRVLAELLEKLSS